MAWHMNCESTACFVAWCLSCVTHAGCACLPFEHQSCILSLLFFFCSLYHRNCETSELKMGPRHTITHSPQTFPHLQRSSNTPHSLSLTRTWSHKGETQESCHLWTTINLLSVDVQWGVAFFMFLHNRAWVGALIEKVMFDTKFSDWMCEHVKGKQ